MEFTNLGKILLQRQWQINQHNKAEVKQGIQTNFDVIVTMKGFNKCMEFFANQIELSFLNLVDKDPVALGGGGRILGSPIVKIP